MSSWETFLEGMSEHFWIAVGGFFAASAAFWKFVTAYMNRKVKYQKEDGPEFTASFKPQQASLIEGLIEDLRGCTERHMDCVDNFNKLRTDFEAHVARTTGLARRFADKTEEGSEQRG